MAGENISALAPETADADCVACALGPLSRARRVPMRDAGDPYSHTGHAIYMPAHPYMPSKVELEPLGLLSNKEPFVSIAGDPYSHTGHAIYKSAHLFI